MRVRKGCAAGPRRPTGRVSVVDVAGLVDGVLAGERRAVARAISAVEDDAPELAELSAGIYRRPVGRPRSA